jgi:cold shock protein
MSVMHQTKTAPARHSGRVKLYTTDRGYGFVSADDGAEWFFHASQIDGEPPSRGDRVTFDLGPRDGREQALRVRREP